MSYILRPYILRVKTHDEGTHEANRHHAKPPHNTCLQNYLNNNTSKTSFLECQWTRPTH